MAKRKDKSQLTRELIIGKAIELFSQKGYGASSIRELAKECGISLGLMYNYFPSKEALLDTIISESISDIAKSFDIQYTGDLDVDFEKYLTNVVKIITERKDFWRTFHQLRYNRELIKGNEKLVNETMLYIQHSLNKFLSVKKDGPYFNLMIFGMIEGMITHFLIIENYPIEEVKNEIVELYRKKL